MKWLKKYELASLNSLIMGSHFDFQALYKTYLAEKNVDYQSFLKLYNRFKDQKKMEHYQQLVTILDTPNEPEKKTVELVKNTK